MMIKAKIAKSALLNLNRMHKITTRKKFYRKMTLINNNTFD